MSKETMPRLTKEAIAKTQPAQKPLTVEHMKENFETWHKETYVQSLEIYGDTYKNMHVRNRWQGWLAAHGIKENT